MSMKLCSYASFTISSALAFYGLWKNFDPIPQVHRPLKVPYHKILNKILKTATAVSPKAFASKSFNSQPIARENLERPYTQDKRALGFCLITLTIRVLLTFPRILSEGIYHRESFPSNETAKRGMLRDHISESGWRYLQTCFINRNIG